MWPLGLLFFSPIAGRFREVSLYYCIMFTLSAQVCEFYISVLIWLLAEKIAAKVLRSLPLFRVNTVLRCALYFHLH
jgi:hypothetical protein